MVVLIINYKKDNTVNNRANYYIINNWVLGVMVYEKSLIPCIESG